MSVFHGYGSSSKTAGFGSEPAVFHGSEPPIFCGFSLVSWFSGGFSRVRHRFGSKKFEPEPNHNLKIDGFD